MDKYAKCVEKDLGEGVYLLENVLLTSGAMCDVYFGPGGVFAVSEENQEPALLYEYLSGVLGTGRLKLFIPGFGIYEKDQDPLSKECGEEELPGEINRWICPPPALFKQAAVFQLMQSLKQENGKSRGFFEDEEGNLFIYRGEKCYPASPKPARLMQLLTVFFGPLGLHRFAAGQIFTGAWYLFTAGLFGFGWLLDVALLYAGRLKDRKNRYIAAPKKNGANLFMLPVGAVIGGILIRLYFLLLGYLSWGLHTNMLLKTGSMSHYEMESFVEFVLKLFG